MLSRQNQGFLQLAAFVSKRALWPFQVHLNKENFGKFNKASLASSHFFASESENFRKARIKGIERNLTPTLSAWPLRGHTALKSILRETLFLDQLHDSSLSSSNSFLHSFIKSKFSKKISCRQHNFIFEGRFL